MTHPNLCTSGGRLFLDYYVELVELTQTQQLAMEVFLRDSLRRVQIDDGHMSGFFPMPRMSSHDARPILVSPVGTVLEFAIPLRSEGSTANGDGLDDDDDDDNE